MISRIVAVAVCLAALRAAGAEPQPTEASTPNPNVELPPWVLGTGPDTSAEQSRAFHRGERWYGAPMLAMDGSAIGLGALAVAAYADNRSSAAGSALAVTAIGLYLLGGPLLDGRHGSGGHGIGMFLARLGLPAAGGLVGGLFGLAQNGNNRRENGTFYDTLGGAAIGLGVGAVGAMIWDNLTAFEPVSDDAARVSLTPIAAPRTAALALRVAF
jgi:hypothetical protein